MTRISVNPTPGQIRSAVIDLLSDYAVQVGLSPARAASRGRKTGWGRRPAITAKARSRVPAPPEPDIVWMHGKRAVWKIYVMPEQSDLRRLAPSLSLPENLIVCVDSSDNTGIIDPAQLLRFLKLKTAPASEKMIQSLENHISGVSGLVPDYNFKGEVRKNHQFVKDHFALRIRAGLVAKPIPGQFLQLMCDPVPHAQSPTYRFFSWNEKKLPKFMGIELIEERPFLRRPFSIASFGPPSEPGSPPKTRRLDPEWYDLINWTESEFEVIYIRIPGGAGTRLLSKYCVGDKIDVVGPLGMGFKMEPLPAVALLVGGGIGAPPLLFLAEALIRNGVETKVFIGALNKSRIPFQLRGKPKYRIPIFERLGVKPVICTDDGSAGYQGLVTDPVARYLDKECESVADTMIFACGPRPMLAALAGIASRCDVPCEVLIEERMACGFGACISCVCAIKETGQKARFTRICTEGPAFDVKKVMWRA